MIYIYIPCKHTWYTLVAVQSTVISTRLWQGFVMSILLMLPKILRRKGGGFTMHMSQCMHVCIYISMCLCIYVFMYVCMCVCVCMQARMYARMHACMQVCMHACMHVCMYVCMHVCTQKRKHRGAHLIHLYIYTCICINHPHTQVCTYQKGVS